MDFAFDRVFVPSLVVDQTELVFRQAGLHGDEAFVVWAGTLAGGHAHVGSIIVPRSSEGGLHGEISADTTARVFDCLDQRDLVPVAQVHSHPKRAFLSKEDAIRPLMAAAGFLSIVVPDFGFVDVADVGVWSAHEYRGPGKWHTLSEAERRTRFIIDDSVIRVD